MTIRPIHWYVSSVVAVALVAVALQDWNTFRLLPSSGLIGLAFLIGLGLLSEATALRFGTGRGGGTSSVTFLPLLACVILFGPTASVAFFGVTGVLAEFLIRKKETIRAIFNSSQYVLSTAIAGVAFQALGGYPLALQAFDDPTATFDAQFLPFAAFGTIFLVTNNVLVFIAISLTSNDTFGRAFGTLVRRQTASLLQDLFISPLGILLALLYFHLGLVGLAVGLFPLVFVRHSYLAKFKLEQANHDLLKALVMAIETRDEYTSGHSLRVQSLSERIGVAIGLSGRQLEDLSTAALLHDIGKIEIGYEEILQKPGSLTEEERLTIQSHVIRGVEILRALSSLRPRVIEAVRYHHESWDGSGYPHGIQGETIPLYARIIGISDAIDAMLSDRPYRRALSLAEVQNQLRQYKGIQFDPRLADHVLEGDMLVTHIEEVTLSKGLKAFDSDAPSTIRLPSAGDRIN